METREYKGKKKENSFYARNKIHNCTTSNLTRHLSRLGGLCSISNVERSEIKFHSFTGPEQIASSSLRKPNFDKIKFKKGR